MNPTHPPADAPFLPVLSLADLPYPPPGKRGWPWTDASPAPDPLPPAQAPPPIGIVTPSLNQGDYLEAAIRSVLLQGYPALEFHVIDGGSTDQTLQILSRYGKLLSGWVSERDRGQAHAINKGMARLARAQWVAWLNSDDLFLPGALHAIARWAVSVPTAVAVIGRGEQFFERRRRLIPVAPRPDLDGETLLDWRTHAFLQPSCFFSKPLFDRLGGLDESLHFSLDFELWMRLGQNGRFDLLDFPIAREVVHPGAKTHDAMGACYAEICQVLFRQGRDREARRLIEQIYAEFDYLSRFVRPIADNPLYRRFLRPLVRRLFAPPHLKPQGPNRKTFP